MCSTRRSYVGCIRPNVNCHRSYCVLLDTRAVYVLLGHQVCTFFPNAEYTYLSEYQTPNPQVIFVRQVAYSMRTYMCIYMYICFLGPPACMPLLTCVHCMPFKAIKVYICFLGPQRGCFSRDVLSGDAALEDPFSMCAFLMRQRVLL
jgi:hypothetical protein